MTSLDKIIEAKIDEARKRRDEFEGDEENSEYTFYDGKLSAYWEILNLLGRKKVDIRAHKRRVR